jgi:hypothetical protein
LKEIEILVININFTFCYVYHATEYHAYQGAYKPCMPCEFEIVATAVFVVSVISNMAADFK